MPRIANQNSHDGTPGDDYVARVAKLIPSEVIATYLAIGNLFPAIRDGHIEHTATWTSLVFFWIATPIVLLLTGKAENRLPSKTHVVLSTIAFPIWAYNISGQVYLYGLPFNQGLGGIFLILFTFISGLIPLGS